MLCPVCGIWFDTKEEYMEHNRKIHGARISGLRCPKCGYEGKSINDLEKHNRIH